MRANAEYPSAEAVAGKAKANARTMHAVNTAIRGTNRLVTSSPNVVLGRRLESDDSMLRCHARHDLRIFRRKTVETKCAYNRWWREAHAKQLVALGSLGEFELWISASQATDICYILSDGGKRSQAERATERLQRLRKFVRACSFAEDDIDAALASTWVDFEDSCINQIAHKVKPDAVVTGNLKDFALSDFPVFDCDGLFTWIERKYGVSYTELAFPDA